MALVSNPFTSRTRIIRKIGAEIMEEFADHLNEGAESDEVIDDAINAATEEIWLHAGQRYSKASMASSELIMGWATTFAAWFLMQTRGFSPPEAYGAEVERIFHKLERIGLGTLTLPGVSQSSDYRPGVINRKIDLRHRIANVRVTKENSLSPQNGSKLKRMFYAGRDNRHLQSRP